MYDYPPYYDKQSDIFETNNNGNLRYSHGYKNYFAQNVLITWVSKNIGGMFLSDFTLEHEINPCPSTNICNYCEQINKSGDIFYAGGNVEKQEYYAFRGHFQKKYHYR